MVINYGRLLHTFITFIISQKGGSRGHMTPIFWVLNANSSKLAKGSNFRFGTHAPRQSPNMTREKNSRKGGGVRIT